MPIVHVREEESFENALRRFKRKCEKAGVLTELKKRQHFEKPSVKRKRKAIQAKKKMLRKVQEERRMGLYSLAAADHRLMRHTIARRSGAGVTRAPLLLFMR